MAKNRKNLKEQIRKDFNDRALYGVKKSKASEEDKKEYIYSQGC